jgi:perosamine synthetase
MGRQICDGDTEANSVVMLMCACSPKIYYAKPSVTELEVSYAADAVANGWGEKCYDYITRFENSFKDYIGSCFAHATSSATGALHLGLAALGIGPGDEVILADTNWIASASPIVHLGATPIFVDILPDTWCIDPQRVEEAVTPRTKAIIAVHLYGNLCDMDRLEAIATKHKLHLIEDAAEALGSRWGRRLAGSRGIFGIFSFHGTKTATTGEGGMFVTNDELCYETVRALNNHGRTKEEKRQFWASMVGYKFKISNVQAAIGCAQMERIEELVNRKREIFFQYKEKLLVLPEMAMNPEPQGTTNCFWMPTVVYPDYMPEVGPLLQQTMQKNNIDTRAFFYPLSQMPMFDEKKSNLNSYNIHNRALNLASYYDMNEYDVDKVIQICIDFYNLNK